MIDLPDVVDNSARNLQVWVVDSSADRRAALFRGLSGIGLYCEPFANLEELREYEIRSRVDQETPDKRGLILVNGDEPLILQAIVTFSQSEGAARPVVAYTMGRAAPAAVSAAFWLGASGYFTFPGDLDNVRSLLLESFAWWRRRGGAQGWAEEAARRLPTLTPRQKEVLLLIVKGKKTREVAAILGLSPRTVEIHRNGIMKKLGISSMAQAIIIVAGMRFGE
jgi:FixJ family two-component response regulator